MQEIVILKRPLLVALAVVAALSYGNSIGAADELPNVVAGQSLMGAAPPPSGLSPLTFAAHGSGIHVLPTLQQHAARVNAFADAGPLLYHSGGSIMPTAYLYAIFWLPASGKLQNGQSTSLAVDYRNLQIRFLQDYARHSIGTITTQYFQTIGSVTTFITGAGGYAGSYIDTSEYPPSGCNDPFTPGSCLTDAQIQAEIAKVVALKGWGAGLNSIFLLYTSSGEGSCFDSSSGVCAYSYYCAYHGAITSKSPNIIYANLPYGNLNVCQVGGTPSPNGNAAADAVISVSSHEISEAITDPLLDAWFTAQQNEIADLCNFNYGSNTWDGGKANQWWNGHYYEVQMLFDNHANGCAQAGPF